LRWIKRSDVVEEIKITHLSRAVKTHRSMPAEGARSALLR